MWPGFHSQIWHHMWLEFCGSLLFFERAFLGTEVGEIAEYPANLVAASFDE